MKKIHIILVAAFALLPFAATAQMHVQDLPADVQQIVVSDNTHLDVHFDAASAARLEVPAASASKASVVKGGKMQLSEALSSAVLRIPVNRSITFSAEDNARIDLHIADGTSLNILTLLVEDNASVRILGDPGNDLTLHSLYIRAEDNAGVVASTRVNLTDYDLRVSDQAKIVFSILNMIADGPGTVTSRTSVVDDHGVIDYGTIYYNGELYRSDTPNPDNNYIVRHHTSVDGEARPNPFRYHRDVMLRFNWGFHNWSSSRNPIHGFEGQVADQSFAARTTFNNIQLSLDYPLFGTRHFGAYVGLGLEWDKYKLVNPAMNTVDRYRDIPVTAASISTRYVVVPLSIRFDLGRSRDWALEFSALPGLFWRGKHSGLRVDMESSTDEIAIYDRRICDQINPYKLDLRASLRYNGIGLYVQAATMSALRKGYHPLYPVKFGLSIALD